MHKNTNTRITVVSEGCLYQGIRTERAFSWVFATDLPAMPAPAAPSPAEFAKSLIAKYRLEKYERKSLCSQVDLLEPAALATLIIGLKRLGVRN